MEGREDDGTRNRTADGRMHLCAALTQQCSLQIGNGRSNIGSADTERDQRSDTARSRSYDEGSCEKGNVSVKTIETHRSHLDRKPGHPTKAHLVVFAQKNGRISVEQRDIAA